MDSEREYEAREARGLSVELRDIEQAALADRRAARAEWSDAMRDSPALVGERVGWLLDGCYGKGSYDSARRVLGNARCNRVAILAQLVAALEWRCPQRFAQEAWRMLPPANREAVNAAVAGAIKACEDDIREEAARQAAESDGA